MTTPDDARRWADVEEAVELLREDDIDAAVPLLRATLERDPGNVYAHFHLGTALVLGSSRTPLDETAPIAARARPVASAIAPVAASTVTTFFFMVVVLLQCCC